MRHFLSKLKFKSRAAELGQGMTEYGLVIALVSIVAVGALTAVGGGVNDKLEEIADALGIEEAQEQGLGELFNLFASPYAREYVPGSNAALQDYLNEKLMNLKPGESFTLPGGLYIGAGAAVSDTPGEDWWCDGMTVSYEDLYRAATDYYTEGSEWSENRPGTLNAENFDSGSRLNLEYAAGDSIMLNTAIYEELYAYDQANGGKYGLNPDDWRQ